jgi:hypothetical protein
MLVTGSCLGTVQSISYDHKLRICPKFRVLLSTHKSPKFSFFFKLSD